MAKGRDCSEQKKKDPDFSILRGFWLAKIPPRSQRTPKEIDTFFQKRCFLPKQRQRFVTKTPRARAGRVKQTLVRKFKFVKWNATSDSHPGDGNNWELINRTTHRTRGNISVHFKIRVRAYASGVKIHSRGAGLVVRVSNTSLTEHWDRLKISSRSTTSFSESMTHLPRFTWRKWAGKSEKCVMALNFKFIKWRLWRFSSPPRSERLIVYVQNAGVSKEAQVIFTVCKLTISADKIKSSVFWSGRFVHMERGVLRALSVEGKTVSDFGLRAKRMSLAQCQALVSPTRRVPTAKISSQSIHHRSV